MEQTMNDRRYIAIGTNTEGSLWSGHFGMSPRFAIYSPTGELVEVRPNPYGAGNGPAAHHDNPRLIVELLHDCGVFIAQRMGDDSRRNLVERQGVRPVLTEAKTVEIALHAYLASLATQEDVEAA